MVANSYTTSQPFQTYRIAIAKMGALSNLLPLIVLFVVLGGGAYIGYQIYMWSNEMTDRGKKHMFVYNTHTHKADLFDLRLLASRYTLTREVIAAAVA